MKDKAALYMLYQAVDENGLEKISGAKTAKEAWDELARAYKCGDRVKQIRLQNLRGELETAQMAENENASDYIDRVQSIASQLRKNEEEVSQNRIVEKILRSLTDEYDNVVCVVEESKDLLVLTVEELAGSLAAHEQRRKKRQPTLEQALQVKADLSEKKQSENKQGNWQNSWQGNWQGRGGRGENSRGRSIGRNSRGRGRGPGGQRPKPNVDCYNCGKRTLERVILLSRHLKRRSA